MCVFQRKTMVQDWGAFNPCFIFMKIPFLQLHKQQNNVLMQFVISHSQGIHKTHFGKLFLLQSTE